MESSRSKDDNKHPHFCTALGRWQPGGVGFASGLGPYQPDLVSKMQSNILRSAILPLTLFLNVQNKRAQKCIPRAMDCLPELRVDFISSMRSLYYLCIYQYVLGF